MWRPASAENSNTFKRRPERRHPILQKVIEHGVKVFLRWVPRLQQVVMDSGVVDGANRRIGVGVGREQDALGVWEKFHRLSEEFDASHLRHPLICQKQPYRIVSPLEPPQ